MIMDTIPAGFFGWLLRVSCQASILVMIILLMQWALQKKLTAAWRHALWLLVLIRLVLPVSPQSTLSIFNWVGPGSPAAHSRHVTETERTSQAQGAMAPPIDTREAVAAPS